MHFKQQVFQQCRHLVLEKIGLLQKNLDDLRESGANETKSTAGDKHETALAMLQIEQENNRRQLKEASELLVQLDKLETIAPAATVVRGSLVKTNRGYLYLSVALGKMQVNGINVITLSPASPLGSLLPGAGVGATISMNGVEYTIEEIQ